MSPRFLLLLFGCFAALVVGPAASPVRAGDPTPAITAIASLTDPSKLATLKGERSANDRLHKIMAWLEEARLANMIPSKTMDEAQKITGDSREHAAIVKEMLLRNFTMCQRYGVLTPENLARMKRGDSPLVTSGTYNGQAFEVDHIVPVAEYPQLGNELANFVYLPRTLNRRKSDRNTQAVRDHAQRLIAANVIADPDHQKIVQPSTQPFYPAATPSAERGPRKVNLNRAAASTLEKLPGIGPKTAGAIIAARPIKDFDALDAVPGIGPKTIEGLKELVEF